MEDGEFNPEKELDILPDKFLCHCGCKTGCELAKSKNMLQKDLSACSVFFKRIGCKKR